MYDKLGRPTEDPNIWTLDNIEDAIATLDHTARMRRDMIEKIKTFDENADMDYEDSMLLDQYHRNKRVMEAGMLASCGSLLKHLHIELSNDYLDKVTDAVPDCPTSFFVEERKEN